MPKDEPKSAIVATFADRAHADSAICKLHDKDSGAPGWRTSSTSIRTRSAARAKRSGPTASWFVRSARTRW
jgi:hypothetical protein